jgi:MYXO-CTERM domain-containing protein
MKNPRAPFVAAAVTAASLLLTPRFARARDVYVAEAEAGASDGSSCASPAAVATRPPLAPGDTCHLCGVFTSPLSITESGTAMRPVTIVFERDAKFSAPVWSGPAWDQAGAIRVAAGGSGAGAPSYLVIDGGANGRIEATASATGMQGGSQGVLLSGASHVELKNLAIVGMYVRTSSTDDGASGTGVYVDGGTDLDIHDLAIDNAQTGIGCVYGPVALGADMHQVRVHHNTLSNINWGISFGDGEPMAIADGVQIYANDIHDLAVWDSPSDAFHHDGIFPFLTQTGSTFTNLAIYGNEFHGDIGHNNTAWIFVSGPSGEAIYDNIFHGTGSAPNDGAITTGGPAKIFNNTFAQSGGICVNATAGSDVENNIMSGCPTAIGLHGIDASTVVDDNVYFGQTPGQGFATVDPNGGTFSFFASFAAWQSQTMLDAHSHVADPKFVDLANADYRLAPGSLAIDTGTSAVSQVVTTDFDGVTRPQGKGYDIGAFEYCPTCATAKGCSCVVAAHDASASASAALIALALAALGARRRRSISRVGVNPLELGWTPRRR